MKAKFLAAFAAVLAVSCLSGCQAMYRQTPEYWREQARKAAEARDQAEADAINSMVHHTKTTDELDRDLIEYDRKLREDYAREHPDHPGVELPLSASPDAREVHINGRTYTCAGKSTVYCE